MQKTYLPGDTRVRIQDLIRNRKMTQAELADRIGLSESALSRYLQGKTEMLGDGYIIRIAKIFDVSTDFLLGETDIPDRKNYDIEELGLTAKSAELLYTGKIDSQTLNLLLEDRRFPKLIDMLRRYQNETVKQGIIAMNEQLSFLSSLFSGYAKSDADDAKQAGEMAKDIRDMKEPAINADLTAIQGLFMQIVKELKEKGGKAVDPNAQELTRDSLEKIRNSLVKDQDYVDVNHVTPEDLTNALSKEFLMAGLSEERTTEIKNAFNHILTNLKEACYDK